MSLFATVQDSGGADWRPDRNVEIIVPTGPGGGNDRVARTVDRLLKDLNLVSVTTSILNKPGAGGVIGWTYLNQHAGDGHYVATSTPALLTTHIAGRSDISLSDITPLAQLYTESSVFVVKANSSLGTAKDLIERLRRDPAGLTATIGTSAGNNNHIALAMLAQAVGSEGRKVKAVVFRSSSEATTAVLGGHVDLAVVAASSHRKFVEDGSMKALAVASPLRLPGVYANVPTWTELGLNVVSAYWIGAIGPRGLSRPAVEYWDRVFFTMTRSEQWKRYLALYALEDSYMDAEASGRFLEAQYKTYVAALAGLGLARTAPAK